MLRMLRRKGKGNREKITFDEPTQLCWDFGRVKLLSKWFPAELDDHAVDISNNEGRRVVTMMEDDCLLCLAVRLKRRFIDIGMSLD